MTSDLFDRNLRSVRRDRAAAMGAELLLFDRAFDDCLDRLRDISRPVSNALLIGCPSREWPERLRRIVRKVDVVDPGASFAGAARGLRIEEDRHDFGEARYDLCIAVGTLDTVNDLPLALSLIRRSLRPDTPLIGAIAGGNSLPVLRAAMIEAGQAGGRVVARTHPRIEASSLAQLLTAAGFTMPVVDVDRVGLRYSDLHALVRDLRAMGATSILASRPPPFSRSTLRSTSSAFLDHARGGKVEERIEILHFIAWNP